jgi:hypothetical protein
VTVMVSDECDGDECVMRDCCCYNGNKLERVEGNQ